jgi:hypothetical protein
MRYQVDLDFCAGLIFRLVGQRRRFKRARHRNPFSVLVVTLNARAAASAAACPSQPCAPGIKIARDEMKARALMVFALLGMAPPSEFTTAAQGTGDTFATVQRSGGFALPGERRD